MKVSNISNSEIEGDDFEGMDAGIDKKNLGFLFDIVSNQMYRRPINSIVREITSNCFDSHVEAQVDDPVIVTLDRDDGGCFISFLDFGVGMSPERMKKVYSKYFSSTKRESNDYIGSFGLGSKSPLSYTDSFMLNTVYNNIRYEYLIHKGPKTPRIDLLLETEEINRNQTEVKIYMKQDADIIKFADACASELLYFDNVFIDAKIATINHKIVNDYKIVDYKTFKFRADTQYSEYLHICIGKAAYPISWDEVGRKAIEIPAALKFEIGELSITPERESIRYVDIIDENGVTVSTKQIVLDKIDLFLDEITDLYKEQTETLFNDYTAYLQYKDQSRPIVKLGTSIVNLNGIVKKPEGVFVPLAEFKGTLPNNLFFEYSVVGGSSNTQRVRMYKNVQSVQYYDLTNSLALRNFDNVKFTNKKYAYIKEFAGSMTNTSSFTLIKQDKLSLRNFLKYTNLSARMHFDLSQTNLMKQVKLYRDYVHSEFLRLTFDYGSVEIPKDWSLQYDQAHKRKVVAGEGSILVHSYGHYTLTEGKEYVDLDAIEEEFEGFIIYGFDKDEELLKNYRGLLINSKYGEGGSIRPSMCKLWKIAQRTEKYIIQWKNTIYVEDFMGNNEIFKKFATTALIAKEGKVLSLTGFGTAAMGDASLSFRQALTLILPKASETLENLHNLTTEYGKVAFQSNSVTAEFTQELLTVAEEYNLYDKEMYEDYLKLKRYATGLEIINFLVICYESLPCLVDFLILKGKKVDPMWTDPNSFEFQTLKENYVKLQYCLSVYGDSSYKCSNNYYNDNDSKNLGRKTRTALNNFNTKLRKCAQEYQSVIKYHEKTNQN